VRAPWGARRAVCGGEEIQDREQDWELEIGADLVRELVPEGLAGLPVRARWRRDLPDGAWEALSAALRSSDPRTVLVLPPTARPVSRRRSVYSPTLAWGVGPHRMALWVQAPPQPRVAVTVHDDQVTGIELHTGPGYSRLRVTAPGRRLTVRYHPAGGALVDDLVAEVRRRLATPAPVPANHLDLRRLPSPWQQVLVSRQVRLDPDAPVAAVFGRLGTRRGRHLLLAVTPYELVAASTPRHASGSGRAGLDVLCLPRARLERVSLGEARLSLSAGGDWWDLPLDPALREPVSDLVRSAFAGRLDALR
jgi:hypothetical protein